MHGFEVACTFGKIVRRGLAGDVLPLLSIGVDHAWGNCGVVLSEKVGFFADAVPGAFYVTELGVGLADAHTEGDAIVQARVS